MGNRFRTAQTWLTRLYGWGRGGIVEISEYSTHDITRTVFWYDQNSPRAGDYSPFGTILMNQTYPDGISEDVRDYIFLHEVGHDELNWVLRLLYWPAMLVAGAFAFAGIVSLLSIPLELIIDGAPEPVNQYVAVKLLLSVSICVPFVTISWADELYADLHAISYLGLERYLEIRRHIREQRDTTLRRMIRYSLQYPPIRLVEKVASQLGYDDRS